MSWKNGWMDLNKATKRWYPEECTWLSTSMAMSTNMSCSSLMLLSRRTISLCLDSISLRACFEIPESTICKDEQFTVTMQAQNRWQVKCQHLLIKCESKFFFSWMSISKEMSKCLQLISLMVLVLLFNKSDILKSSGNFPVIVFLQLFDSFIWITENLRCAFTLW